MSVTEQFIRPSASAKMRRPLNLRTMKAVSSGPSSGATPSSTNNPAPICPTRLPSTTTDALLTRCTTARIFHLSVVSSHRLIVARPSGNANGTAVVDTQGLPAILLLFVSNTWGYSSAGRAPAWHAGGRGFEPPYLHHSTPYTSLSRSGTDF